MHRSLLIVLAVVFSFSGWAQKIPLVNSGEVLEKGKTLYDSGKYEEALKMYSTIPERDTNYVSSLAEMAITYNAMKQPEKTLEICEKALAKKTSMRAHLLKSRAIAADYKGDYEKSVAYFIKAIEEYPFDYGLHYNLGVTYFNHHDYEKAQACFFRAIEINPFHTGSHLNLASLAIGRERRTHAMFSMGIYLSIAPGDNDRLVILNKFLDNQLTDAKKNPPTGPNGCEKLDQVIRARIAMDNNFKSSMPLNAAVVRQFEMFFQQLSSISTTVNDPWVKYYLPIYKAILEQGKTEPFLYSLVSSSNNEDVKKWIKKNNKQLDAFYQVGNINLKKRREVLTVPATLGYDAPVQAWYIDGSPKYLEALGKEIAGEIRQGRWIFYYSNNEKSAEGNYNDKGEKTGVWKYYRNDGTLKEVAVAETGEVTEYSEEGFKTEHYFSKDAGVDGPVEIFYNCGVVKEKLTFKEGKRQGLAETFYPNGKVDVSYHYLDNKLHGETLSYFEDGKLYSKTSYKNGERDGRYEQYYANGKLRMAGNYLNGKGSGEWKYYYINGVLERVGKFVNDEYVGEWTFYDKNGVLTEKTNYNNEGKKHGQDSVFYNGKIYIVMSHKNDRLVQVTYLNPDGKTLGKYGNESGTFPVQVYFPTGELKVKGEFKKGNRNGLWKFYYRTGGLSSEYEYVDGKAHGAATEYYESGAKKIVTTYKDDEHHGYHQEFYQNGQTKVEGWFQDGDRQQQWVEYSVDGKIESDFYYINDRVEGDAYEFNGDGKIIAATRYENDVVQNYENFGPDGKSVNRKRQQGYRTFIESYFNPKFVFSTKEFTCGMDVGEVVRKYPDGKTMSSYALMNNSVHGLYQVFTISNKLEVEGRYVNGSRQGLWKGFYENGNPRYVGYYFNKEQDSVWTYYHANGKIQSIGNFAEDQRHGLTTYHGPDGSPLFQKMYDNGDLLAYRPRTTNNEWGEWKKFIGDEHIVYNYASGVKGCEESFKKGDVNGKRIYYYPNGKVFSDFSLLSGDYHGPYSIYYPNGKVMEKGNYKFDARDGVVEYFNEDGSLNKTETYSLGNYHGKSTLYNKGTKTKEITFWYGIPLN
jgi:uncharacterized protein